MIVSEIKTLLKIMTHNAAVCSGILVSYIKKAAIKNTEIINGANTSAFPHPSFEADVTAKMNNINPAVSNATPIKSNRFVRESADSLWSTSLSVLFLDLVIHALCVISEGSMQGSRSAVPSKAWVSRTLPCPLPPVDRE